MSCFCNGIRGTRGLNIDPSLVEDDLRTKISYIALVQTKEQSHRVPRCPNDRHYGVRVVVRGAPGAKDKHVFLFWSCQDNNLRIEDVTGTPQIELYEQTNGKQVLNLNVTVFQLRDNVISAGIVNDCLSVAKVMFRTATGAEETIASAPESDHGGARVPEIDIRLSIEEMNTRTRNEAERMLEGRAGFDFVM